MRRSSTGDLQALDPEIERTLRQRLRELARRRQQAPMAEERTLRQHFEPQVNANYSGLAPVTINANNFELKPGLITMVQNCPFAGLASEDPQRHLANFLEIADLVKMNGVTPDVIKMKLFPFSLRDKAKDWWQGIEPGSITSFEDLTGKFLGKFFPPAKTSQLRTEIAQFRQWDAETLTEAWERYKSLLRKCPQHGYPDFLEIQFFFNGISTPTRDMLNAASGGSLLSKTPSQAKAFIEDMAINTCEWSGERSSSKIAPGLHVVDPMVNFTAQMSTHMATLTKQMANLASQIGAVNKESVAQVEQEEPIDEQVAYANNYNNNFNNNAYRPPHQRNFNNNNQQQTQQYHPGLRNQDNPLSYGNKNNGVYGPGSSNQQQQFSQPKPSLEENLNSFITEVRGKFKKSDDRMDNLETHVSTMGASMKNLEMQVGQLAQALKNKPSSSNPFPSDTMPNPKQCNAVTLRSAKKTGEVEVNDEAAKGSEEEDIEEESAHDKREATPPTTAQEVTPGSISFPDNPIPIAPKLPYPQRFAKNKLMNNSQGSSRCSRRSTSTSHSPRPSNKC